MANFHVSKDGVARQCRAKTPESCTATPADQKEHYDTKEEAQKAYEKSQDREIESLTKKSFKNVTKNTLINKIDDNTADAIESNFSMALEDATIPPFVEKQGYYKANKHYKDSLNDLNESLNLVKKSGLYDDRDIKDFEEDMNIKKFEMEEKLLNLYKKDEKKQKIRIWDNADVSETKKSYNEHIDKTLNDITTKLKNTEKELPQHYINQRNQAKN